MIKRYSVDQISKIWDLDFKYQTWLKVEILTLEAFSHFNYLIDQKTYQKIAKDARVNSKRILEIEKVIGHDVGAFVDQVSENLGKNKKWFHYGLTSSDIVETSQSYQLKLVNEIIERELLNLSQILKQKALLYKDTLQIGRTHGVHAEPTTFGLKLALWYDEIKRHLKRFALARSQIEVAKISGAVGNFAHFSPNIQTYVAKKLGLYSTPIANQILQRDRHAFYLQQLALIGSSLEKFAFEIRNLQRTEIGEVFEGFNSLQKGSSAMPHKKNPILSENISGLARLLRGYALVSYENIALWHERDISHSSNERVILPDATNLIVFMLTRFSSILNNLVVNVKQMQKNINSNYGVCFSQRIMLYLIQNLKSDRQTIYRQIQKLAQQALDQKRDFSQILLENKIITLAEIPKLFDYSYFLKNIDFIFKNLM